MTYFLIVNDSPVDRRLAGQLLERETHQAVEYASNGVNALELLERKLPLVVVTDLQMPEMDGMQLTAAIRQRFPTVPVIVMTAYGSEEIAVEALLGGAADYVPKTHLATELAKAVRSVLAITAGERGRGRLSNFLRYEEVEYELENDLRLIPAVVDQLQQVAADLSLFDDIDRVRLAKALGEALRNAIWHGNLEISKAQGDTVPLRRFALPDEAAAHRGQSPYCDRRVHVRAAFSTAEARFTIRDEGPGFDPSRLPDVKTDPSSLSRGSGRGLVLIRTFMDEVRFNPSGNEITLVKRGGAGTI